MLKAGITGGIGSGKSLCSRIFSILGAPVYYADIRARELIDTSSELQLQIQKSFGEHLFAEGTLDRKALATIVFNNREKLESLNKLVHPFVFDDFNKWIRLQNTPYSVMEAAILFESGFHSMMDKTILVTAPEELRIMRVTKRDLVSREEVVARIHMQFSDEKKSALADIIITNDSIQPLIPQILKVHSELWAG
ncbi:MAG: dephospho-CoA kinase [Bacteroidota bacterium]